MTWEVWKTAYAKCCFGVFCFFFLNQDDSSICECAKKKKSPLRPTEIETPDTYLIKKLSFLCIYNGCLWATTKQVSKRPPGVTKGLDQAAGKLLEESQDVEELHMIGKQGRFYYK